MQEYIDLGKQIYDMNNPREVRRMVTFVIRAVLNNSKMQELLSFFRTKTLLQQMIESNPFPIEQVTRAFFYKGASFKERSQLIREHYQYFSNSLTDDVFLRLSCPKLCQGGLELWSMEFEEGKRLKAVLSFEGGQRKEGLLSIIIKLEDISFYQIIFWAAKDKNGKDAIWIGAMQGPNVEDAKEAIKRVTKFCHGYRTKNLSLYVLQAFARALEFEKIYAVTNEGYYANNHVRVDRKLKTSFSDFWAEAGGTPTDDSRFYSLPLIEARKTMEEVPTRKRAVYRRRFVLLDEIDEIVADNVKKVLRDAAI